MDLTSARQVYQEEARMHDVENDARIVLIVRGFALKHVVTETSVIYLVIELFAYVHTEKRTNRMGDCISAQVRVPSVVRVDSELIAPRLCVAAADRWLSKEGRLQALRVLALAVDAETTIDETN